MFDIRISVRGLVEFLLRSGDIDNRKAAAPEKAMLEGTRIHRMLQMREGGNYRAEVPLFYEYKTDDYCLRIEGRADGIILEELDDIYYPVRMTQSIPMEEAGEVPLAGLMGEEAVAGSDLLTGLADAMDEFGASRGLEALISENSLMQGPANLGAAIRSVTAGGRKPPVVTIDEIKGTYRDVQKMKHPVPVHLAQAKCYAYMYACKNPISAIRVRMTYCNLESEDVRFFYEDYTFEELREWFENLLRDYERWVQFTCSWYFARKNSIQKLEFPFPYRDGQKDLVTYVYRTIIHEKKLFIEAPTGVGKTISTVYPAIKAMGEDKAQKLFYLTAKTITRTVAEQAFDRLRDGGLKAKTVVLTAKEKICFAEEVNCNPVACPYAKGHYDRINDAMFDLLMSADAFTRETVEEYARKHMVCPFELSLDMSLFSDAIIGDYNYLFDPHAYLRRFFQDKPKGDYIFLVDEAHNLVDRGRDMYSATLLKEDFLALKREIKDSLPQIAKGLDACNKELLYLKRECTDYMILDGIEPFILALNRLAGRIGNYLEEHSEGEKREEILLFYFEITHFLLMYENAGQGYLTYCRHQEDGTFMIKLFCVDPSQPLSACMKRGRSTVLFSATLLPIRYYKKLLGAEPGDYEVYAHSVFAPEQKEVLIGRDVTSRYKRRGISEYRKIAAYIDEISKGKVGNYLIFFPSHAFLQDVWECFEEEYYDPDRAEVLFQTERMDEAEREAFLHRFDEPGTERSLLGFCVLGGIFSEGIDLQSDSLIGAVIVGTGLPLVCLERELLKKYFSEDGENGFDYAYRFPGMNKVLQAAGRVIRTEQDLGVIALLDERFMEPDYQRLFPREWTGYRVVSTDTVSDRIREFWKNRELPGFEE